MTELTWLERLRLIKAALALPKLKNGVYETKIEPPPANIFETCSVGFGPTAFETWKSAKRVNLRST